MTWSKNSYILGPGWHAWTPSLSIVCDVSNPTSTECPGTIDGLSWNSCKYTSSNGEFFGILNGTITNTGSHPYGGTRNHWQLNLPVASVGSSFKTIGRGFWHTDTNPDRQGKIVIERYPNFTSAASFRFIKVGNHSSPYDSWAKTNLSYSYGWIEYWDTRQSILGYDYGETIMTNNSWGLRRLASNNDAWSGSAEAWTAPSPTIDFSIAIRYMIQYS